jgi:bifunctional UDP-N-acetylglucosamine pyrophosphorylase/glucosamine-1-phosphate N-acetyltransferase
VTGINTRAQLAEAEAGLRRRVNARWMAEGVTLIDPDSTYIELTVTLGRDTVLWPNTHLQGQTVVGAECVIGPNTIVRDSTLGDGSHVECSVLEGAWLGESVEVGPFAHLRQGARLERGAHMGNFGEIKNSTLGPGVKMGHFSYIGDAVIGADTNIGAGTITCNYDGVRKNKTVIGAGAFIGSDTMLVAPVTLGDHARTGAGSVVTKDVPPDSLAVGVPARVIRRGKASA